VIKIISGGQTGVDRGALDAALAIGVECGGWCPSGRLAEDGRIPKRYPLSELESRNYRDRTLQNVIDSDGTVIFYFGIMEGGTKLTSIFCKNQHKPYLCFDATKICEQQATELIHTFTLKYRINELNIAGPRASKIKNAHKYTMSTIAAFLQKTTTVNDLISMDRS